MRPPCYSLLEEIVILGVIYGSLVWRVFTPAAPAAPAAPAGPRSILGLSPLSLGLIRAPYLFYALNILAWYPLGALPGVFVRCDATACKPLAPLRNFI